ncbi:hypothetical protein PIB30_094220 [Stylosanthes scabra]|uniref:Uncharacterized protein n=1 Tax=Stylosanthes scabra TaxID=79078 RepID=A0ABU6UXV7_9FABA|nr:hypothetical protein [Stylosanthes scabra]
MRVLCYLGLGGKLSGEQDMLGIGVLTGLLLRNMSCINFKSLNLENYVDNCYKGEAYVRCYESVIHPLNDQYMWERSDYDDFIPPPFRAPSHGSTKKRRRIAHEEEDSRNHTHFSSVGQIQKCSNCGAACHKRRVCPKPVAKLKGEKEGSSRLFLISASANQPCKTQSNMAKESKEKGYTKGLASPKFISTHPEYSPASP